MPAYYMVQRFPDRSLAIRAVRLAPWTVTEGARGKSHLRSRPCMAIDFAETQNQAIEPILHLLRESDPAVRPAAGHP